MQHWRRLICFVLFAGLLITCPRLAFAQTFSDRVYPFAFTPAPSILAQEVAVSGPDRVYIMEELKPSFKDGELQLTDNNLAITWRNGIYGTLESLKDTHQLLQVNGILLVNVFINQAHITATRNNAPNEDWQTPTEFFNEGGRHSGDYAMAKYYALKALGVSKDDMCLAFVKEPDNDMLHVVLIVRRDGEFLLLDSISDQVYHNGAPKEYIPQYYFNETTSWRQRPAIQTPVADTRDNAANTVITKQNNQQNIARSDAYKSKIMLEGFAFDITPPPDRNTGVSIIKWKRICEEEDRFPSFKGGTVNISDRKKAMEWGSIYGKCRTTNLNKKIVAVNDFFNQWVYKSDQENWGKRDYWATPREFMEKSGDCEDYAIAKYFALRALNVPTNSICLVWVRIAGAQESHMILIVLDKDDFYVLDNNTETNTIYKNSGLAQYQPIFYMNEDYTWKPAKNN